MKITHQNVVASGKWLSFQNLFWLDDKGVERQWECVSRVHSRGAVLMIPVLRPSGRLVLIRQFRPPAACPVLEFPAGLIDDGEQPEVAAVRELREETGFRGSVDRCSGPAYNSPGLTSECIYFAVMTVNEEDQSDRQTDFDDTECIETLIVEPAELASLIRRVRDEGGAVDAKVAAVAEAWNLFGVRP